MKHLTLEVLTTPWCKLLRIVTPARDGVEVIE
jgi:hypothetical protein